MEVPVLVIIRNSIMNTIVKFTSHTLLLAIVSFYSCKKELSCFDCKDGNKPPTAIAGADQKIVLPKDSVLIDGSASSDADGKIIQWMWEKVSGPA